LEDLSLCSNCHRPVQQDYVACPIASLSCAIPARRAAGSSMSPGRSAPSAPPSWSPRATRSKSRRSGKSDPHSCRYRCGCCASGRRCDWSTCSRPITRGSCRTVSRVR
jgi:hypothetical protein